MKKTKKILTCMLSLLCVVSMLSACSRDEGEESQTSDTTTATEKEENVLKIAENSKTEYKIVQASSSDEFINAAAELVFSKLYAATGAGARVTFDSTNEYEYEIVIGETSREAELGFDRAIHDWESEPVHVGIYGKKLLITADNGINLYRDLGIMLDELLKNADKNKLLLSESDCERAMSALDDISDDVLTIMMQNVCTFGDAPNTRAERFERVYKEFEYYDADVIGISEGIPQWINYLDEKLTPLGYGRAGLEKTTVGEYNDIYYKKDKLKVIEQNTLWYSETPEVPGTTFEAGQDAKVLTYALFEVKSTGTRFMVFNTHLAAYSNNEHIRVKQVDMIMEVLSEWEGNYPVYLMGDMNFIRDNAMYGTVTAELYDAKNSAAVNLSGDTKTYNGFLKKSSDGDYIFTGKSKNQETYWFKVLNERRFGDYELPEGGVVSDHYGICIRTQVY